MNRRLIVLLLPFVLALFVLLPLFIPPTIAAGPDLVEETTMTLPVGAAAINLNDNLFQPARLTTQNQAVFGPSCTTDQGDPFSPINSTLRPPNHYVNPDYSNTFFSYRYRILIPSNYEATNGTNIVRVELFDPDSYNWSLNNANDENGATHIITTTSGTTTTAACSGNDRYRTEPCILPTGESQEANPLWFIRMDEIRRNAGSSCDIPPSHTYANGQPTITSFDLYYYRTNLTTGLIEPFPVAKYVGRADNAHGTDMRWVSPGGAMSYDQNMFVPVTSGSSFEVDLTAISDVLPDPITGLRMIYLDVTSLAGASENGFDVWAGPPSYTGPANPGNPCQGGLPGLVNTRNLHIANCGNGSHSSGGVTIAALDYQPTNYNTSAPIEKKLVYIGPEYAGETIYVSLFDSDSGAQSPLVFYFDTLAFTMLTPVPAPPANPVNSSLTDWFRAFAVNNTVTQDPDLLPGESRNCYPGTCNNTWITPTYRIQVPTLSPTLCVNPATTPHYCTPFYGGWLTVRYLPGYHETATWQVEVPEPPLIDTTVTCPGLFPVTFSDSVHSMTADDYLIALNTPSNVRYPPILPAYSDFLAHTPDTLLDAAEAGDIFLFVGEGWDLEGYGLLQWNFGAMPTNDGHVRLRNSLTWPGNVLDFSFGFHEVGDWNDTRLQIGDRVAFSQAEGNAAADQLAGHIDRGRTLQLLAWSELGVLPGGGPGGSDIPYARASQFINFRLLGYNLGGSASGRWLLAEFMGRGTNCGQHGPDISFADSSYSVSESSALVPLTVQLSYALANTVTVSYTTHDGTATAGQDYAAATGFLTFPPGTISQTLPISLLDDLNLEGSETFSVTLANPQNAVLSDPNSALITIHDNEVAAQLSLTAVPDSVNENEAEIFAFIMIDPPVPYTVTVAFNTSDGTAIAGEDYSSLSYVATFSPWTQGIIFGQGILDDTLLEGPEAYFISLSNPTPAGVTISGTNPITITILDDEVPAEISFAAALVTVPEDSGSAQVVIQQNQAHTSPLHVSVTTSDVTAIGGTDYTIISDVITFNGAAAYTLTIPILDDTLAEGHELFWVTLSDPLNGLIVSPNPMAVIILDDECAFGPTTGAGRLEAEDFTCGGEGVAYHDSTPGNQGTSSYRFAEDVDVWNSAAASQARYVGNTVAGEWLVYTLVVTETGRYDLSLAAAGTVSSQVRVEIDGLDVTGGLTLPGTGGGENFAEVAAAVDLSLTAGVHEVRLFIISGGANLDYLAFSPTPPDTLYLPFLRR